MAQKKFNYLFVAAAAALLLLLAAEGPTAGARSFAGVNPWCRTASHKRLCNKMVKNATNWHDASVNSLRTTLELAKRLPGMVPMVKPAISTLEIKSQKSILDSCIEDFEGRIVDMEKSLGSIQVQDIGSVMSRLSAALHGDCEEALAEFHVDSPVAKYTKLLHKEVDNCLAVILQT
ncbi:hypothetical protein ABFS82_12G119700 [Erythranthe guttata]